MKYVIDNFISHKKALKQRKSEAHNKKSTKIKIIFAQTYLVKFLQTAHQDFSGEL